MKRYFIEIAYKGTNYHGWQIQKNAHSVQEEINKAISTILQTEIMIFGAGRTDAGVHATQMFAHFDTDLPFDIPKTLYKLNNFLPKDIACKNLFKVSSDTHARFSASKRTYEYRITLNKNPFLTSAAYYYPYKLAIDLMNEAAKELLKYTDFSCFSKSNTDTFTNNCKITEAFWIQENDVLIFTISADRFLRNMVRAIVGTLLAIGQKKLQLTDLALIVNSKNRSMAGVSVPAHGLYLTKVEYPFKIKHNLTK